MIDAVLKQLMERTAERDSASFGPRFMAAFAQSNEGDTSPNIQGAYCWQSGAGTVQTCGWSC